MQISRHWRMNSQRYRLEGVRYANGRVSIQPRPARVEDEAPETVQKHMEQPKEAVSTVCAD